MAATTLNSPRAVEMSLYVVRAFVRLRELLATNRALARKLDELESRLQTHDDAITGILRTLRELMNPPVSGTPASRAGKDEPQPNQAPAWPVATAVPAAGRGYTRFLRRGRWGS
jgi:hypothetical protein